MLFESNTEIWVCIRFSTFGRWSTGSYSMSCLWTRRRQSWCDLGSFKLLGWTFNITGTWNCLDCSGKMHHCPFQLDWRYCNDVVQCTDLTYPLKPTILTGKISVIFYKRTLVSFSTTCCTELYAQCLSVLHIQLTYIFWKLVHLSIIYYI